MIISACIILHLDIDHGRLQIRRISAVMQKLSISYDTEDIGNM